MSESGISGRLRRRLAELGKLTPIALVTAFLPMLGTSVLFAIGYPLAFWLKENPVAGAAGYAAGVLVFCGLALVPTNVIGILGGFAFGLELGLAILIAAVVGASVISYLIHTRIVGDKVPDLTGKHPKANAVYNSLLGQGFGRTTAIILLIRLSIVMPFAFTNFMLASAKVPLSSFVIGTFLGMLPRFAAVAFAGSGLAELSLEESGNFWIVLFGIAASFLTLAIISVASKRALDKLAVDANDGA